MKAILWTAYGSPDVLKLQEIEKPTPKDHEILIRIRATTVTAGDCELRSLKLPVYYALPMRMFVGFRKPTRVTIPGMELAGEVEAVGEGVTRFKAGDTVFGMTGFRMGACAEYICLPEDSEQTEGALAPRPVNLSFEAAAAVPVGGLEALHFLRRCNIQPGEKVLINGAGGSIGTIAVQLTKHYGAEVTAVDRGGKLDMLRSIGADRVIDYTKEDFTQGGERYDVIFDVAGKSPFSGSLRSLKPGGLLLLANPSLADRLRGRWISMVSNKKVISGSASHNTQDILFLKELIEAEKIKPVVDRCYPLEQIVTAHRYVETGQKRGNVVINVE